MLIFFKRVPRFDVSGSQMLNKMRQTGSLKISHIHSCFSNMPTYLTFLGMCAHSSFTPHFIFSSCGSSTSVSSISSSILQQKYQITQEDFFNLKRVHITASKSTALAYLQLALKEIPNTNSTPNASEK